MEPNPYLVCSSIMFTIPTSMGAYYRQWNLYFTFLLITIISSIYHATKNQYLVILDYAACYNVVYVLYRQTVKINQTRNFIVWCAACAVLFWGGYVTNHFVFSPESFERNISHVGMHLIVIGSGCAASYLTNKQQLVENESKPCWKFSI
jgi:hypothetical protein